ncbi:MAG: NAD(P)/FAD-dependent oxidoreductase [Chthonomonadales bacterium]
MDHFDVTIIGAGPVGLFGSFYAGMRGMKTLLLDSLPEPGGQLSALYPEKFVYDMPGFPKILARDLARDMTEQGTRFAPTERYGEKVEHLVKTEEGFQVQTDHGVHETRTVVICAGAGAFSPKLLEVDGIEDYHGRGLHYFVKNKSQFEGKRLLIIGGGDSALDWAQNLEPLAKHITLIHRRDSFRANEESVDWLMNRSQVETHLHWELRRLSGEPHLREAHIYNNHTQEEKTLEVDACLINIGFHASIGPIREWGLELEGGSILVNTHMESSIPGVYSAGDICTYDGKIKLIATGVGEVCIAVNYAKRFIDPKAKVFPGHSSGMDMF